MSIPVIRVEVNPWYHVNKVPRRLEIVPFLRHVSEICVVENEAAPPLAILVNGEVLGLVDPFDEWEMVSRCDGRSMIERIRELQPAVIFKYQWRRGIDYPPGTISAGYPCFREIACPADLLQRHRGIEVTARMRANRDYHWGQNEQWMLARTQIVEQAMLLDCLGRNVRWGLAAVNQYLFELWNTQIGFDWRGSGYLTHRIIEYIRAGVVPITREFGAEWPVREDVVLEDGIHCIVCAPHEFAREALLLLGDRPMLERIRRNLLDLWRERLGPLAQGYWFWRKLEAALPRKQYQAAGSLTALISD